MIGIHIIFLLLVVTNFVVKRFSKKKKKVCCQTLSPVFVINSWDLGVEETPRDLN